MKQSSLNTQQRQPELESGADDAPQHLEQSLLGNQALLARLPGEREPAAPAPRGGRRLDPALAASFGGLMDTPLDDVRVHTGDEAAQTLNSVGGDAATLGQHVFLGGPVADVHSPKGRRALAHELQHVGQDQRGEVHGEEGV